MNLFLSFILLCTCFSNFVTPNKDAKDGNLMNVKKLLNMRMVDDTESSGSDTEDYSGSGSDLEISGSGTLINEVIVVDNDEDSNKTTPIVIDINVVNTNSPATTKKTPSKAMETSKPTLQAQTTKKIVSKESTQSVSAKTTEVQATAKPISESKTPDSKSKSQPSTPPNAPVVTVATTTEKPKVKIEYTAKAVTKPAQTEKMSTQPASKTRKTTKGINEFTDTVITNAPVPVKQTSPDDNKSRSGINFTLGIIIGVVVGAVLAILIIVFLVYRLRKKDEGSYSLDEQSSALYLRSDNDNLSKEKEYFA